MLEALLLILKIAGIIFAVILILLALILLVPFSYVGKGVFGDNSDAKLKVRSFLWIVYAKAYYTNDDKGYVVRIFGIPVIKGKFSEENDVEEEGKDIRKEIRNGTQKEVRKDKHTEDFTDTAKKSSGKEIVPDNKPGGQDKGSFEDKREKDDSSEKESVPGIIMKSISRLSDGMGMIRKKFSEVKRFLKSKGLKLAYVYAKDILLRLYMHARPNKLEASLTFGFDSPDMTGKALGVLGMLYAVTDIDSNRFSVTPDFDKKCIVGNVYFKGRFVTGYVIVLACKLYFRREIQFVIKQVKSITSLSQ